MFALFRQNAGLEVIRGPATAPRSGPRPIELVADRTVLAKRRWRGTATDGHEFGFDLEFPLRHGECFFQTDTSSYVIAQTAEAVLRITLDTPAQAARLAWHIGNMHFPVSVADDCLIVEDEPILRQILVRESFPFTGTRAIFQPLGGAAIHTH